MIRRRLCGFLALAFVLAGCGLIGGLIETEDALREEGFREATVDVTETAPGPDPVVVVTYETFAESPESLQREAADIARIVWEKCPVRLSLLYVEPLGRRRSTFTRDMLEMAFGPRPPGLKEQDIEDVGRSVVRGLVIGGLVFFFLLAGVVVLIVVLVRRSRRNRAQAAYAGGWSTAPGGPMRGQPQQPWGPQPPGSWGQPQPGQWGQQPPPPGPWGQPPAPPPVQPPPPANPDDPWSAPGSS